MFGGINPFVAVPFVADAAGSLIEGHRQSQLTKDQINAQREFAQKGVRWKVADAKAAGVHPLAALGAPTTSFSPVSTPSSGVGEALSSMGQGVSRAIDAASTREEREFNTVLRGEMLKKAKLENSILEGQATLIHKASSPPLPNALSPIGPMSGQSGFKVNPAEVTASMVGRPAQEAGAINEYGYSKTDRGFAIVPSKDVKERIEDSFIPETAWSIRNQILPSKPPKEWLPKGATHWEYSILTGEFVPAFSSGGSRADAAARSFVKRFGK